ncbi:MAG: hypothetical protein QOI45_1858 [Thermoleophilaceae bacterium]|nr:hypothetical protein [Thermoleophilaceae bacterium]
MAHANAVPVSGSKLDNRRVLAALIDLAIVGLGWAVILAAAGVLGQSASEIGPGLSAVAVGWALYYYFACESGSGQTLGKRVMKIRVAGADGRPAEMREIGLRTVLRVIDGLFFYLVGLIVMIATGERRGRLGDLVAHTKIVDAGQPARAAARVVAPAPVPEPAVSRVPIAESGPAFAETVEVEQEAEPASELDVASPSLRELAADVTAVTESPEREVEEAEEPVVVLDEALEDEPYAELDEDPPADADDPLAELDEEPVAEAEDADAELDEEPVAEVEDADADEPDEAEEEVTVKSVETVSAMDVVMGEADQDAVAEHHADAPRR